MVYVVPLFRPVLSSPQILRTLDIQVALTGLEVWTKQDQSPVTPDANATLWAFLQWHRMLWARLPHDSAQLLTWVPPIPTRVPAGRWQLLAPPGHAALHPQGPHLSGQHCGPSAHRGYVPCRELRRRERGELPLGWNGKRRVGSGSHSLQ